jgi:tRNA(Ile)-lysidine synthase
MDAFLAKLRQQLTEFEQTCAPSGYAVAFSGGVDSTVLLAACQRLKLLLPLRALHIDHGLHSQSGQWARQCATTAQALGVDFESARITVSDGAGGNLEAIARERRYGALGELLRAGEMLLTAHHEEDQLETLIMRLLRGAGVKGLRGILARGAFAGGYLGRPLLVFSKEEIVAVATAWRLEWLEDPSNREQRFDRNYLRSSVLPAVKARWPAAARTVARAARQMAEAEALLGQLAAADAGELADPARVPLSLLRRLDRARRRNLLRYLLAAGELPLPSARQLEELIAAVEVTRRDAQTRVQWPGAEARVHGECLYLMVTAPDSWEARAPGMLRPGRPWTGPEGRLELVEATCDDGEAALPDTWVREGLSVQFRRGGEVLKPFGALHHRRLKKLLQEAHVVPWMRQRIPLLYRAEQLVAVGDLWVCEAARPELATGPRWRVRWTDHPSLY